MQPAIPKDIFDGDTDTVLERIDGLLRTSNDQQIVLLIGLKIGFIAGVNRPSK